MIPSETRTVSDFKPFWDPKYHAPPTFSHSNATQAVTPRPRAYVQRLPTMSLVTALTAKLGLIYLGL